MSSCQVTWPTAVQLPRPSSMPAHAPRHARMRTARARPQNTQQQKRRRPISPIKASAARPRRAASSACPTGPCGSPSRTACDATSPWPPGAC
eukprot:15473030-Alexandrium_andersonii.AAC.1